MGTFISENNLIQPRVSWCGPTYLLYIYWNVRLHLYGEEKGAVGAVEAACVGEDGGRYCWPSFKSGLFVSKNISLNIYIYTTVYSCPPHMKPVSPHLRFLSMHC